MTRFEFVKKHRHPGLSLGCFVYLLTIMLMLPYPGSVPAQDDTRPDLNGVWVSVLVSFDDPRWRIADLVCARTGCSVEGYAYLQSLLDNPENENRTTKQLVEDMEAYQRSVNETLLTPAARASQAGFDPSQEATLDCTPDGDGLRHQVLAPLPLQIEQQQDKVILRYEYWNAVRTVHLVPGNLPEDEAPSRLGQSVGHYEGSSLVVETRQLLPSMTSVPSDKPLMLSPDARAIERYTLTDGGQALDVTLEIIDPLNFTRPFQNYRRMLIAPGWELDEFECKAITGKF